MTLIDGLESCRLLMYYCDVFSSLDGLRVRTFSAIVKLICFKLFLYEQSMVEGVGNNKFKHQKTLDHIHYRKDIHIRFKFHFDVIYKKIHNSLEI